MIRPHPDPLLNIRHRISNEQIENWDGCDVFSNFSSHRYTRFIAWKCWCPKKYNSCGSICGRYISVDVPSIAPTTLSSLVHEPRFSLYSFIVPHCTNYSNALIIIGMHLFISVWTVATPTYRYTSRKTAYLWSIRFTQIDTQ
jgi:hypothetical protein